MIESALLESMPLTGEEPAFELTDDAGISQKFVAFHLGDSLYGIAAEKVAEVSRPIELTPLPHSPNGLLGIIGVRDEIFAVVDLRTAIGETPPDPAARMKLVLLNSADAKETRIGFFVDKMFEIVSAVAEPLDDEDDIVIASAEIDAGRLGIINTDRLQALLN
jgi:chemotaxis signal transduction protein